MLKLVDFFAYLSVLLRAGTLVFQSLLLGGVLFVFWIARPASGMPASGFARVRSSAIRMLRFSALGLALVQLLYLYVNSAVLMATAEIPLSDVVGASFFLAGSTIFVAAILVAVCTGLETPSARYGLLLLVTLILAASVMTNHAAARVEGRAPLILLTLLHEAATGFWIGGLPFLILGLFVAGDGPTQWYITQRFSRLALVSVGVLVVSGTGMSLAYIGSLRALYGTAYGVMVSAKAVMLGALMALGGINFLLLRKCSPDAVMPRLRRLVEAEVGIGITVILTAASVTSQPPAVDLVNDTVTAQQVWSRIKPVWPRLGIEALAQSSASATAGGAVRPDSAPKPSPTSVDGIPLTPKNLADIEESELNHHWMGVLVLAMGALALL